MGKAWDSFRVDDPGTMRYRGENAGNHGELISQDTDPAAHPARNGRGVAYGGGKRPTTSRCHECGKRDQRRAPGVSCTGACDWRAELINPHAAPPTMLAFQEWTRQWASEAYRILKPGGHLLAFGGTRTYHRMASGVEDAGFEIRDDIMWQHMEPVFCQCASVPYSHGDGDVPGVREGLPDAPPSGPASNGADVLAPVQREASRPGVGDTRSQGPGELDGREPSELPGEDDRSEQPGMEGRRNAEAAEGQLQWGSLQEGAGMGSTDGSGGRLHHGAPSSDGDARGVPADADGGCASSGSRPVEQRSSEPGAMAVEWIPQGGGAWPGCPRCSKPLAPPFFGGPLTWNYGSGFPKSLDVSKAIDKTAGHWRGRAGDVESVNGSMSGANYERTPKGDPVTTTAAAAAGWGTALKPAHEPIVLARKPLTGTVAANVLAHGTGALNIDGCRIEGDVPSVPQPALNSPTGNVYGYQTGEGRNGEMSSAPGGRWPANVILDIDAAAILDEQTGTLTSNSGTPFVRSGDGDDRATFGAFAGNDAGGFYGDSGGASRFFYVAKASSAERNAGLDGFDKGERVFMGSGGRTHVDGQWVETGSEPLSRANVHPTVKPIELMRWLVRLVTPPGGTVLDPFAGSGTTGIAAQLEGFEFVGLEREPEYAEIARARIAWWAKHPEGVEIKAGLVADKDRQRKTEAGHLSLFDV